MGEKWVYKINLCLFAIKRVTSKKAKAATTTNAAREESVRLRLEFCGKVKK